jgi:DNA processing protein
MAVPGPVGSASSAGCHWLIRERGAVLVTSVADVLELVAPMGTALTDAQRGPTQPRDSLDPLARRVLDAVPLYQPRDVGRIARAAGLAPLEVLRRLGALLAHGLVEQVDSGWRVHPAARPHRPPSVSAHAGHAGGKGVAGDTPGECS